MSLKSARLSIPLDNLLARLSPLLPPSTLLRLGHPARISRDLISTTLDYQTATSAESEIVKDVKAELEGGMKDLSKKKGEKGWLRGRERGKKWEDVRELRKE
jgi:DNA polymerase alpha-associated DNA helicase A